MWKLKCYFKYLLRGIIECVICLVVGYLLCAKCEEVGWLVILGYFLIVTGLGCLIFGFVNAKVKINSTCDSCRKPLKGGEYTYQMQDCEQHTDNQGKEYSRYKYYVTCTCPHCGAGKEFVEKFNCKSSENPEVFMRQRCKKYFGD